MIANQLYLATSSKLTCSPTTLSFFKISHRSHQLWPKSVRPEKVYMPKNLEDRLLPQLPYTPTTAPSGVILPIKHSRADADMRGPERIHNQLIYRQFGLIALGGGALLGEHYDIIRNRVNKYMDTERFFAVWRIDPPWKAVSRKSLGKKMGGGKAKVHHYELPVRAGRVLIEIGGIGEFGEVERILSTISKKLPIYSMPVTQKMMDDLKEEKLKIDASNYNPFEYRYLLRNNFSDSLKKVSPYDVLWGGTYF